MSQQVGQDKTLRMCDEEKSLSNFFGSRICLRRRFKLPSTEGFSSPNVPTPVNPALAPPPSTVPPLPLSLRSPIPRSFSSIHIAISLFELECANSTPSCLPLHGVPISNFLLFAASPPDIELCQLRLSVTVCLSSRIPANISNICSILETQSQVKM